jgi:hypothetical protein
LNSEVHFKGQRISSMIKLDSVRSRVSCSNSKVRKQSRARVLDDVWCDVMNCVKEPVYDLVWDHVRRIVWDGLEDFEDD